MKLIEPEVIELPKKVKRIEEYVSTWRESIHKYDTWVIKDEHDSLFDIDWNIFNRFLYLWAFSWT